jgi:hypothetical protein
MGSVGCISAGVGVDWREFTPALERGKSLFYRAMLGRDGGQPIK